ncbi:MAG TPA: AEC family transporter [Gammaproteobacteria bacterium]|nr:AEC family transporter [Gammaproteobacteria bacterium]
MNDTGRLFLFALSITVPIFMVILLGSFLKRIQFINDEFIRVASNIVFTVGLPVSLFFGTAKTDFSQLANPSHLAVMVAMTLVVFAGASIASWLHVSQRSDRGVYVQGAFRGNLVIIGIAFCTNAFGDTGLALAAMPVAVLVALYNVLSVYVLNASVNHSTGGKSFGKVLPGIIKNPLIIGIMTGLLVSLAGIPLPKLLLDTGDYFADLTIPLALLCIGGMMDLTALRVSGSPALGSVLWKLFASPLLACGLAVPLGIRGTELAVIFFLAASPTAAASFVMTRSMGGNAALAANIVVLSTAGSLLTVTGGLVLLKYLSLV